MPQEEKTYGGAISSAQSAYKIGTEDVSAGGIFFYSRMGFSEKSEGGIKARGIPFLGGGIAGDVKLRVYQGSFLISIDEEIILATLRPKSASSDSPIPSTRTTISGLNTTVIIGNKSMYGGFKVAALSYGILPGVFIGFTIGEKIRFIPELAYFKSSSGAIQFIGLGFQYSIKTE